MPLLITFVAFSSSSVAESSYYRWVDENGVVNYSQQAPAGVEAELVSKEHAFGRRRVTPAATPTTPAEPPSASRTEQSQQLTDDDDYQEIEASLQAELAATKRSNCLQARRNLESFQSRGRIRYRDPEGNYQIMSDESKQQKIREFQDQIRANC